MATKNSSHRSLVPMVSGAALGAALMYFCDPARGRKRRARIVDLVIHARHVERTLVGKAVRDARHRARGVLERAAHALGSDPATGDDEILVERIRAALGRVASHPRAIEVRVDHDRILVLGEIFAHEAEPVLAAIRAYAGRRRLIDRMNRHETAAESPALQGEGHVARRAQTWTPALRVGALAGGTLVAGFGLVRGGLLGGLAIVAGGALAARAGFNRPLGHTNEIRVQKTITVHAPVERVFALWSRFDEFPKFMSHVRDVRVAGDRSHWEVEGPPGVPLRFDAEITHREPNRMIAWRTIPGHAIDHEGVVRFDGNGELTRVHLQMSYRPPAGMLGHAVARLLGWDPKHRINDDLVRMKSLLEHGRALEDSRATSL
jgi:uncharacterized membrane protein